MFVAIFSSNVSTNFCKSVYKRFARARGARATRHALPYNRATFFYIQSGPLFQHYNNPAPDFLPSYFLFSFFSFVLLFFAWELTSRLSHTFALFCISPFFSLFYILLYSFFILVKHLVFFKFIIVILNFRIKHFLENY